MSILVKNGIIVTIDSQNRVIRNGAVYVEDDRIIEMGETGKISRKYRAEYTLDARKRVVMPGLINAHCHLVSSLRRAVNLDWKSDVSAWLAKYKYPGEAELTEHDAYIGGLLGSIENIKNGSTFAVESYFPPKTRKHNIDRVGEAVSESGIRCILARAYFSKGKGVPDVFIESDKEVVSEYERILRKWNGAAEDRIHAWVSPINLINNTPESIAKVHEVARKYKAGMHSHVSEATDHVQRTKKEYGRGTIEVFNDLHVLESKFQAAHCIWISEKEMRIMSKTGATAVHCPASNMNLANGTCPVPKMLKLGVNVALGTDSPPSHGNMNMMESLKMAALLQKERSGNAGILSSEDVLRLATINGARSMGMESDIGSLEVGKKADMILVNMWKPHIVPIFDPVAAIVYSANGGDVESAIIDGKIVMENRVIKTVDEAEVLEKAQEAADNLYRRAYPEILAERK